MATIRSIRKYISRYGLMYSIKEVLLRLEDIYCERKYNVSTAASVNDFNAGAGDNNAHYYAAFHYSSSFHLLKYIPNPAETVLVDFGSGKARFLIAAATFGFKKLIGVEFSDLVKVAEENFRLMRYRKTKDIEFYAGDAQQYQIPGEVNVIFFNNPFKGNILENVISNIHESLRRFPRKIQIIYTNYLHFEEQIHDKNWIKLIRKGKLPQEVSYAVYEAALPEQSGSFDPESNYIKDSQYQVL